MADDTPPNGTRPPLIPAKSKRSWTSIIMLILGGATLLASILLCTGGGGWYFFGGETITPAVTASTEGSESTDIDSDTDSEIAVIVEAAPADGFLIAALPPGGQVLVGLDPETGIQTWNGEVKIGKKVCKQLYSGSEDCPITRVMMERTVPAFAVTGDKPIYRTGSGLVEGANNYLVSQFPDENGVHRTVLNSCAVSAITGLPVAEGTHCPKVMVHRCKATNTCGMRKVDKIVKPEAEAEGESETEGTATVEPVVKEGVEPTKTAPVIETGPSMESIWAMLKSWAEWRTDTDERLDATDERLDATDERLDALEATTAEPTSKEGSS